MPLASNLSHTPSISSPISVFPKPTPAASAGKWDNCDWNFAGQLQELRQAYSAQGSAVSVNFRKLVPLHSGVDRATHLIHSYPAKLIASIPIFFLNARAQRVGTLYDPFCGSGTTLLEGVLAGWNVAGADANPLARLISRVKLQPLDINETLDEATRILKPRSRSAKIDFSPVVDVNRWFSEAAQKQLGQLQARISSVRDESQRQFLEVCLSSCIRKLSYADPRLSVPVRLKEGDLRLAKVDNLSTFALFERAVLTNLRRVAALQGLAPYRLRPVIVEDARIGIPENSVDLIMTSPPYAGAQKYIRSSSLSLGWLGLAPDAKLRNLERLNIGREHFQKSDYTKRPILNNPSSAQPVINNIYSVNPARAFIASTYLDEMYSALVKSVASLKSGGHFVIIIGNNLVCGMEFDTRTYLKEMLISLGMLLDLELVDDIRSRGLMTKRNKTAGIIAQEHVLMFRK